MLSRFIHHILNLTYPMFRRFMPLQTFRYAACGGGNTILGIGVFYVAYNFLFKKQVVHLPFMAFEPHIAAMFLSFIVTFPLGFYLSRNVVFTGSALRGRHQLVRYFGTAAGSVALNYFNLKVMVEALHIYPTIAQIINTVVVVIFSYLMQKHFAFRHAPKPLP
ncbi:MAG: GtrA family protein [Bacteroidetes bacterium]|nr:MAG: GtrA family protein [Bacteroidota bacterium]